MTLVQSSALHATQELWKMQQENKFCDSIIESNGFKMNVHKNILAASCDYFYNMLSNDWKENQPNGIIDWSQVLTADLLPVFMKYIYTSSIDMTIDNVLSLTEVAHMLMMEVR